MAPSQIQDHWLKGAKAGGCSLLLAPPDVRANREVVLAAVKQSGIALKYAAPELFRDHEIVNAAVTQNVFAYKWAAEELKHDFEISYRVVGHYQDSGCPEDGDFARNAGIEASKLVLALPGQSGPVYTLLEVRVQGDGSTQVICTNMAGNISTDAFPPEAILADLAEVLVNRNGKCWRVALFSDEHDLLTAHDYARQIAELATP